MNPRHGYNHLDRNFTSSHPELPNTGIGTKSPKKAVGNDEQCCIMFSWWKIEVNIFLHVLERMNS